jgi:hypothetical protein
MSAPSKVTIAFSPNRDSEMEWMKLKQELYRRWINRPRRRVDKRARLALTLTLYIIFMVFAVTCINAATNTAISFGMLCWYGFCGLLPLIMRSRWFRRRMPFITKS